MMEFRIFHFPPLLRASVALVLCALPGCMVQFNRPVNGQAPPAFRRWADSVSTVREAELAAILTGDRGQRRPRLAWHPVLAKVARERAWDMAARGYFSHVNPDGIGPNTLVERAGYRLPAQYDHRLAGNNIESAAEGYASAATAWRRWMGSTYHRTHLLGLNAEFQQQTEFGIGFAMRPGNRFGGYWVVLIARPAEADSAAR